MPNIIIWELEDWTKYCCYNPKECLSNINNLKVIEITEEELNEIKNCTSKQVQDILLKYK